MNKVEGEQHEKANRNNRTGAVDVLLSVRPTQTFGLQT